MLVKCVSGLWICGGMEWEQLGQHVLDNAIRQRRRRLRGCVNADGGQFEHSL